MRTECERIGKLVSEYVDNGLNASQRARVADHLNTCSECAEEVARIRLMVGRLGGLSEENPPFDLWPGVARKISASPQRRSIGALAGWRVFVVPAAAAAAAVVILFAHTGERSAPTPKREIIAEYPHYARVYNGYQGQQPLPDRDAVAAAAVLNTRGAP